MDFSLKQMFELVKAALKGEKANIDFISDSNFYNIAQENGISGLIFPALDPNQVPESIFQDFQKDFYEYLAKDSKQMSVVKRIKNLLNENQITHIFLKGTYLKSLYPDSYMRSMGDIDVLVKAEDLTKVHQIFESDKIKLVSTSPNHDIFNAGRGVCIEVHPKLDSEFNGKYKGLFADVWKWAKPLTTYQYQFQPEYHLVYLFYHSAKHISGSGIGFRSILDLGLLVEKEELNLHIVNELLKESNLENFSKVMLWFSQYYFGFKKTKDLVGDYQPDEDFILAFTKYLCKSGIHGTGKNFNTNVSIFGVKANQHKSIRAGRRRTILRIIFPKFQSMKAQYSYLNRHPYLLFWAYISRFFRLAFKKRKRSIKLLKKLKVNNQDIAEFQELYKNLGL